MFVSELQYLLSTKLGMPPHRTMYDPLAVVNQKTMVLLVDVISHVVRSK